MIDVTDVTKTYRAGGQPVEALRGITLHIASGTCNFIVGPSGSGKSTLLYLLGGLDRPDRGSIRINGEDLTAMSEGEQDRFRRDRVGFIFQAFNLVKNLTAIENVLLPYYPRGISRELTGRAATLLSGFGLGGRLKHRPYQMSGGEQQRVAIARALIKAPALVLADEPTGELDTKSGDEIYALLRRVQAERSATLVVVTHDRRFITSEDLVFEIRDGRVSGAGARDASASV
jgi:putative ABC transport system ATP-binding protein